METPIRRVLIFPSAHTTHRKDAHGGLWAIVGNILDDSITRAAMSAVDEWVSKTSIFWISHLTEAITTNCDVWGDKHILPVFIKTLPYRKLLKPSRLRRKNLQLIYVGQGGKLAAKSFNEAIQHFSMGGLHFNDDTMGGVQHIPSKIH
jgi:hypothetical protein